MKKTFIFIISTESESFNLSDVASNNGNDNNLSELIYRYRSISYAITGAVPEASKVEPVHHPANVTRLKLKIWWNLLNC